MSTISACIIIMVHLASASGQMLKNTYERVQEPTATVSPLLHDIHARGANASQDFLRNVYRFEVLHKIILPQPTNPLRKPTAPSGSIIAAAMASAIAAAFPNDISSNVTVSVLITQINASCTLNYLVTYGGSSVPRRQLVDAANEQRLCAVLGSFCSDYFPSDKGFIIDTSSGRLNAPTPPVTKFNCVRSEFEQRLDHFDNTEVRTFSQVYWVCDAAFPKTEQQQRDNGTLIVFLGNEGTLGIPKQPIVFENAERMQALVILVEHRYYGESMPFNGNTSTYLRTWQYKWLTLENVIQDTVTIVRAVRSARRVPVSVPTVVVGGSYGGQLSAYHRLTAPEVFDAAVAASADIMYVLGTKMWLDYSNRYHQIIAAAVKANSKGTPCFDIVRSGLLYVRELIRTRAGRKRLGDVFQLCRDNKAQVVDDEANGISLLNSLYDQWLGLVQTNYQPVVLNDVEMACNVVVDAARAVSDSEPADPEASLAALAKLSTYSSSDGSPEWCLTYDNYTYITDYYYDGIRSYVYQSCTQGMMWSSFLPASGSPDTLAPATNVSVGDILKECRSLFGELPPFKPPTFTRNIKRSARQIGGIVFTNGELDGWGGGSVFGPRDFGPSPPSPTSNHPSSLRAGNLAYVTYKGISASHCTDTHTYNWGNPYDHYKRLRSVAMDYALWFMRSKNSSDTSP